MEAPQGAPAAVKITNVTASTSSISTMIMAILMFGDKGADIVYPDPGFPIYRSIRLHRRAAGPAAGARRKRLRLLGPRRR